MTEKTFTPRRFLFCGLERPFRGPDRATLREVLADGTFGPAMSWEWSGRTFAGMTPGWTYEFEATTVEGGGTSVRFGTRNRAEPVKDDVYRQALKAKHDAALLSLAAEKAADKMRREDRDLADLLGPVAKAYADLKTEPQRVAFEVALIVALRRGRF